MRYKAFGKTLLSIILIFVMLAGPGIPVNAEGENNIYIRSVKDLISMSKDCRLDTNSLGKNYILSNDISLDTSFFEQIPVFRGTFEGNGHTIKGFAAKSSIAPAGLFGIIESDGVVKNLKLCGNVIPTGDGDAIGGIAGINRGLVEGCEFTGNVSGKEEIGGIAGINDFSGIIRGCVAGGKITGQKHTGGIVGNNSGMIEGSISNCLVNADSSDPTINIDEIESDMQAMIIDNEEAERIYSAIEDGGGIAGFSNGIITNCTNNGDVGYSHIGYNMGGVVGRNQGFIYGSSNYGTVNGRREVGGIAGQAEPYVASSYTSDNISSIRNELHVLNNLVNKATNDVDAASSKASFRLSNINSIVLEASNNVKDLSDALTNAAGNDLDEVNRGGDVAKSVADRLSSISSKLPGINRQITDALKESSKGMDEAKKAGSKAQAAMGDFSPAADDLKTAIGIVEEATKVINEGTDIIGGAISEVIPGVYDINWGIVKEGVAKISEGLKIMEEGTEASGKKGVYHYLSSASKHLKDGTEKLQDGAKDLESALDYFQNTTDILEVASKDVTVVLEEIAALSDYLSNTDSLQFSYIKTNTEKSSNDLHNNMINLNRELESLNTETKSSSDVLMSDIRAINDQFFVVMDLLLDEISDLGNASINARIEDISDEDINNSTDGKAQYCTNYGKVFGDINVGGIAGSMGIFNEQNPEDENNTVNDAIRARYRLKAILQDCTNYGDITSKKDYVGAVCGISSLGIITDCKAYGNAVSEDGDYAGGISGGNSTTIRNSFSKCSVSGGKYVGGITGLNSTKDNGSGSITNCIALVKILSHEQYAGAICGYDKGDIRGNLFFGDDAGINNASYAGKAEPIGFEELIARENIPSEFKQFKVTFKSGDRVVKETYLDYLSSYSEKDYPKIPQMKGKYGKWDKKHIDKISFDEVITAEYFPYVTAIESSLSKGKDEPGKFLAIGNFSDTSVLEVSSMLKKDEISSLKLPGEFFAIIRAMEAYRVSAEDLEGDDILLRYNKGERKLKNIRFFIKDGESYKRVKAREVGSFLEFTVPSGTNEIAIAARTSYIIIFILIVVLIALGILIHFVFKGIRKLNSRIKLIKPPKLPKLSSKQNK